MSNHTPGTWKHYKRNGTFAISRMHDVNGLILAEVYVNGINNPEANARLMAASPELFEAVKIMCKGYKATREFFAGMGLDTSALSEIITNADGLIDRVEGRSEK